MPWNGSGTYTVPYIWVNDANASIPITASRMDGQDGDIANALNNCLTRDGQGGATGNIPMNGFKLTGLTAGTNPNDSVAYSQISGLAPLASPTFTGSVNIPTPTSTDNSTLAASTAFVKTNLANYAALSGASFTGGVTFTNYAKFSNNGTVSGAAAYVAYNKGGTGETDFINHHGGSAGGWTWYDTDGTTYTSVMTLSTGGTLAVAAGSFSTLTASSSITVGGGTAIPKMTISTAAPGTLAVNELWFQRAP